MKRTYLVLLAPLLVLGAACNEADATKIELPSEPAVSTPTKTPAADAQTVRGERRLNGTFEARRTAGISAKVSAPIRKVYVQEGESVAEGDKLFEMDASGFRLQIEQAEASMAVTKSQITTMQVEVDRAQRLLEKAAIAPSQVDQLRGQLDSAKAQYSAANVSLKMARKSRSDAVVKAPFDGLITAVNVAEGEYASAGPTALVTLVERDILLRVRAPEEFAGKFTVGQTLNATLPAQGREVALTVERINPIVSAKSRSFDIIAVPSTQDATLQPGMFAEVAVASETSQ